MEKMFCSIDPWLARLATGKTGRHQTDENPTAVGLLNLKSVQNV